jgi:hypothetical protein
MRAVVLLDYRPFIDCGAFRVPTSGTSSPVAEAIAKGNHDFSNPIVASHQVCHRAVEPVHVIPKRANADLAARAQQTTYAAVSRPVDAGPRRARIRSSFENRPADRAAPGLIGEELVELSLADPGTPLACRRPQARLTPRRSIPFPSAAVVPAEPRRVVLLVAFCACY